MRFNKTLAQLYRANGYLFVARDTYTGGYDTFIQYPAGGYSKISTDNNKSVAVQEAKKLAMERMLGFDPSQDVII